MASTPACFDEPGDLFERLLCVHNVSKDLDGTLEPRSDNRQQCTEPRCDTLKTVHRFSVELERHDCDSDLAGLLEGPLVVEELMSAFEFDSLQGAKRAAHAGDFTWFLKAGGEVRGRISGITNAGTHRAPIF